MKNINFTVVGMAENGKEGVELYKQTSPDIVTLDITMPVMGGLEALEQIIAYDPNAMLLCVLQWDNKS